MELGLERDPLIEPEVQAVIFSLVSALGGSSGSDEGVYVLGDDALAVLRDIKRWLRLFDDKNQRFDVARLLADANLVKGDLLEILSKWPEDAPEGSFLSKIALLCVDLLTQLTWPIDMDEKNVRLKGLNHVPSLQKAQALYKQAILHYEGCEVLRTVVRVALPAMAQPQKERSPMEDNIIKVVLYLFRNVALITQPEDVIIDGVIESDISRSATIQAFQSQDIFNLLLTICSSMAEDYSGHDVEVLDTIYHLVKGINVERLFMEKEEIITTNTRELRNLISKEKGMLAGYARHAPSRHNRFGTMLWVKREDGGFSTVFGQTAIANEQLTMAEMDKRKMWKKPARPTKKDESKTPATAFDTPVAITSAASKHLRNFVEKFLDSSFNPLFTAVRRAVEREADRVLDIHKRQYLYLISWFLRAESARRKKQSIDKPKPAGLMTSNLEDYALVASVLDQETFVLLNRLMQSAQDEKRWQDLDAGMKCFTQILYTVQDMFDSPLEEDQEIAENILNRIFYEQSTHDRVIGLLKSYNNQGFSFLDACTELSHVFLRLLERYSKQNIDMQVRSKRRARKKKKDVNGPTPDTLAENEDRELEAEDIADAQRTTNERKFDFTKFAARFLTQASVDTYVAFLRYFKDLSDEQLKRAHRYFYRLAFKMDLSVFLFRLDIVALLNKLVKGPEGLSIDNHTFKDWQELVQQVFRKLIKRMQDRPALAVEILFSKINSTMFYLEHGYDREILKKAPRAPAELEIKPGMDKAQEIGVAVSVLINQSKSDILAWLKQVLSSAADERKAWESETLARSSVRTAEVATIEQVEPQHGSAQQKPEVAIVNSPLLQEEEGRAPLIIVKADSEEHKTAMKRDKHVRLVMTLLGLLRLGDDEVDCTWIIPSAIDSATLLANVELINKFEFDPPVYEEGKSAENYVRRKIFVAANDPHQDEGNSSTEGDSASDLEHLFPAGGPTARQTSRSPVRNKPKRRRLRHKVDELLDPKVWEERQEAKRRAELERQRKVKSDLMVHASDDESDEERDRAFFAMEAERRRNTARGLMATMRDGIQSGKEKSNRQAKRKANSRRKETSTEDDEDDDTQTQPKRRRTGLATLLASSDDDPDSINESANESTPSSTRRTRRRPHNRFNTADHSTPTSEAETENDTPATSQPPPSSASESRRGEDVPMSDSDDEGDSNKENAAASVLKGTAGPPLSRRRVMAGFIVESDSDG